MANLFLDFTNGNDGNDGTTFANRFKTITNGATAARVAPPDVVRIMKSEDPVSLGIDATFTNKSDTITLASALTTNIYTDGAWTAATNVTATTNASNRKEGSNSSSLAIASAFTTGLVGYYATGTLNLSGYTKISLWIRPNQTVASGVLEIRLCSDTAGATPVNSITINEAFTANNWKCITVDTGGALGASIQSVALYCLSDPGTVTILLDNILACNALTLTCLLSLDSSANSMMFWPIRSINGTTVKISMGVNTDVATTARGFYGTTATATCYKREPIRLSAQQIVQDSGTSEAARITFSGGWNTTDMTTQTGLTFIDWGDDISSGSFDVNSKVFVTIENMVMVRGRGNISIGATADSVTFNNCASIDSGSTSGPFGMGVSTFRTVINNCKVLCCGAYGAVLGGTSISVSNVELYSNNSYGLAFGTSSSTNGKCTITGSNITSCNNVGDGIVVRTNNVALFNITAKDNVGSGLTTTANSPSTSKVFNITTSGNTSRGIYANGAYIQAFNVNCAEASPFSSQSSGFTGRLEVSNISGNATDNRTYEGDSTTAVIVTETSSGRFWQKHSPTGNHASNFPLVQSIQAIPVAASGTVTIRVIVKRSSTNISARLMVRGGQCSGITTDQTADASASANTEETLTLTVTPGQAVPLEVEFQSWRVSGSGNAYFANFAVTQA